MARMYVKDDALYEECEICSYYCKCIYCQDEESEYEYDSSLDKAIR